MCLPLNAPCEGHHYAILYTDYVDPCCPGSECVTPLLSGPGFCGKSPCGSSECPNGCCERRGGPAYDSNLGIQFAERYRTVCGTACFCKWPSDCENAPLPGGAALSICQYGRCCAAYGTVCTVDDECCLSIADDQRPKCVAGRCVGN